MSVWHVQKEGGKEGANHAEEVGSMKESDREYSSFALPILSLPLSLSLFLSLLACILRTHVSLGGHCRRRRLLLPRDNPLLCWQSGRTILASARAYGKFPFHMGASDGWISGLFKDRTTFTLMHTFGRNI